MLTNFTKTVAYATTLLILIGTAVSAQTSIRSYSLVYSENLKGATTLFGNTMMHIVDNGTVNLTKMNQTGINGGASIYGNDNSNMTFIDIDGNTGVGAGTRNSSSADLVLP